MIRGLFTLLTIATATLAILFGLLAMSQWWLTADLFLTRVFHPDELTPAGKALTVRDYLEFPIKCTLIAGVLLFLSVYLGRSKKTTVNRR